MDTMSTMMTAIGQQPSTMLSAAGYGIKSGAQIGGGFAAKNAADFEAAQYNRKAAADMAAGTVQAQNAAEHTAQVSGAARARAAASGASVSSPTISDILGGIAAKGKTQQRTDIYSGQVQSDADIAKANAAKAYGKNAMYGSILEGLGTGLQGYGKLAPRLGLGVKSSDSVTDADSGDTIIDDQRRRRVSYS